MQALWYTHQSASTGRHKDLSRCHRHARRHARIRKTSTDSSRSARAPSACTKPRRQPMIESTRAAWGASAVDRCKIRQDHGPGVASDLLRGGLGGPSLGLDVLEDCAPSAALLLHHYGPSHLRAGAFEGVVAASQDNARHCLACGVRDAGHVNGRCGGWWVLTRLARSSPRGCRGLLERS